MKNENSIVDIVMPNYNKGNFLENAINSVINQTFKKWHLYIIDDNSNDNSKLIINKFNSMDNITVINLDKKEGPEQGKERETAKIKDHRGGGRRGYRMGTTEVDGNFGRTGTEMRAGRGSHGLP